MCFTYCMMDYSVRGVSLFPSHTHTLLWLICIFLLLVSVATVMELFLFLLY